MTHRSRDKQAFPASQLSALVISLLGSFHIKILSFLPALSVAYGCWPDSAAMEGVRILSRSDRRVRV